MRFRHGYTCLEGKVDNVGEDARHGVVVEVVDGDHIEVPDEAWSDGVPAASRWTHGPHEMDVSQDKLARVFLVVPTSTTVRWHDYMTMHVCVQHLNPAPKPLHHSICTI